MSAASVYVQDDSYRALTMRVSATTDPYEYKDLKEIGDDAWAYASRFPVAAFVSSCIFRSIADDVAFQNARVEHASTQGRWLAMGLESMIINNIVKTKTTLDSFVYPKNTETSDEIVEVILRGDHFAVPAEMLAEMGDVLSSIEATSKLNVAQWANDLAATVSDLTD